MPSDSGVEEDPWDIATPIPDDDSRGLSWKMRGGGPASRLKFSTVYNTVLTLELWILFQLAVFWQSFFRWSILVAALLQSLWLLIGIFGPFCCFVGKRLVRFPFEVEPEKVFQWYFFVASGILLGSLVAIIGGYSFGAYSILSSADFQTNEGAGFRADMMPALPNTLPNLEKADFIKFNEDAKVMTIYAARKYSATKRHYYCSAPVMGGNQEQTHIFYFVTSNEGCCLTDDYPCDGWDLTGGFVARIVQKTSNDDYLKDRTKKVNEFYDDAALQAAEASGVAAGFVVDPEMILLQVTDEDPAKDAQAHFITGVAVSMLGLALWPFPAMVAWCVGCK